MPQRIDILDGGAILYDETFYVKENADALFDRIRAEAPWVQERSRLGPFPRLTAWYADAGLTYGYSGVTHQAIAWTPTLLEVRRLIEAAARVPFNSLLLNFYRDGQVDAMIQRLARLLREI